MVLVGETRFNLNNNPNRNHGTQQLIVTRLSNHRRRPRKTNSVSGLVKLNATGHCCQSKSSFISSSLSLLLSS